MNKGNNNPHRPRATDQKHRMCKLGVPLGLVINGGNGGLTMDRVYIEMRFVVAGATARSSLGAVRFQ